MAKRKRADDEDVDANGYRLGPIVLDDKHWLYEGVKGIDVYAHDAPAILSTEVPWSLLCALVDNHRKIKETKP